MSINTKKGMQSNGVANPRKGRMTKAERQATKLHLDDQMQEAEGIIDTVLEELEDLLNATRKGKRRDALQEAYDNVDRCKLAIDSAQFDESIF